MAKSPSTFMSTISQRIQEFGRWVGKFDGSASSASPSPLPSTLGDDLAALQRLLARIEAFLYDAERREICDASLKVLLRDLRGVADDADDVLDEYEYELLRAKSEATIHDQHFPNPPSGSNKGAKQVCGAAIPSTLNMDPLFWGRIANKIQIIRKKFEEIAEQRQILEWREEYGQRPPTNSRRRPPTSSLIDVLDTEIQGRGPDLRLMQKLLLSEECCRSSLTVIPIVGMPGVGKTTLAQHLFNDPGVCEYFELRAWVCVSNDDFDVIKLTKKILESFSNTPCDLSELDVIQRRLIKEFSGKRFLLVLDDVWNENHNLWGQLQVPLNRASTGSVVITTTRSEVTAKIMQTVQFHTLKCLSDEHCWEIFRRFAFHGENPSDYKELVEIGKKIVKKCKGLPLAAKALGRMLRFESDDDKWEDVLNSEIWELFDEHDYILPALMLSFHLPPHMKRRFVYCSLFPQDHRFHKDELVLLWMAQGYNQCKRRKQLEHIGATYVDELTQRSFFQYSDPHRKTAFMMHDLIHALAQYNSKGEYLRMEREFSSDLSHTCHISVVSKSHHTASDLDSATEGLRTLHFFGVNEITSQVCQT